MLNTIIIIIVILIVLGGVISSYQKKQLNSRNNSNNLENPQSINIRMNDKKKFEIKNERTTNIQRESNGMRINNPNKWPDKCPRCGTTGIKNIERVSDGKFKCKTCEYKW